MNIYPNNCITTVLQYIGVPAVTYSTYRIGSEALKEKEPVILKLKILNNYHEKVHTNTEFKK